MEEGRGYFYTGRSADGSDMKPSFGAFVSPDGKQWSNMPYTEEQRVDEKKHNTFWDIQNKIKTSYLEEYELIKNKKSLLSRSERNFIIKTVEESERED